MNPLILMALKAAHEKASRAILDMKPERLKEHVVGWVESLPADMLHDKAKALLRFAETLLKGKP